MSEVTYDQGLSPLQEQALIIKRKIINAWINDFPQNPPSPEPISPTTTTTTTPQRRRRSTFRELQAYCLKGGYRRNYASHRKVCRSVRLPRRRKLRGVMDESLRR